MSEFPSLEWVTTLPPSNRGNERFYAWVAKQLRDHPGEWAKLPGTVKVPANGINKGTNNAFKPAGHYEATSRRELEGTERFTFARYIGPVEEPKPEVKPETNGETQSAIDLQRQRNPDRAERIDQAIRNK